MSSSRMWYSAGLVLATLVAFIAVGHRTSSASGVPRVLLAADPGNCGDCTVNCGTTGNPGHQVIGTSGDKVGRHACEVTGATCDDI